LSRVAYLTPLYFDEESYLGGGERYPLNLAKAVVGAGGYEVTIVSYGDQAAVKTLPLADGVTLTVLPAAPNRAGPDRLSWDITPAIRSADLVHIHQIFSRPSEVAMLVAKLLGKPVCATDHGGASSRLGRSLGMLELADRITCYSRFGSSLFDTTTAIDVVPGGVDDGFFTPLSEPVSRDGIVYVGRLMPHKGIDRLITALPSDLPLTVCGRPYHPEYYELLRALSAEKRVEFITDITDETLRDMYRHAIAVVLPSVYVDCYGTVQPWPELMGFSLLEGMACGAPAICSRVGGMPEYVEHGVTGFVFDEIDELSGYLERLAGDPALVEKLGGEGRRRVGERFGLASAGQAMKGIYDQLLPENGGRS
jgi:glycosyltransferase involved in cell wall biosynthesis